MARHASQGAGGARPAKSLAHVLGAPLPAAGGSKSFASGLGHQLFSKPASLCALFVLFFFFFWRVRNRLFFVETHHHTRWLLQGVHIVRLFFLEVGCRLTWRASRPDILKGHVIKVRVTKVSLLTEDLEMEAV